MPEVTAQAQQSSLQKPDQKPNPGYGPLSALIVTITIYILTQVVGTFLVLGYARLSGVPNVKSWVDQTGPQFAYYLIAEGLAIALVYLFLKSRKAGWKTIGLSGLPSWRDAKNVLLGFAVYFPILIASFALAKYWFPSLNLDQPQQIGFAHSHGWGLVLVFICLVVLPPVTEEILMRGFFFTGLRSRLSVVWSLLATSLLFAIAHLEFGSGAPLLWSAAIDTFLLSVILVWLRLRTGRLWSSIGLHMLKNFLAFLSLFIFVK